MLLLHLLKKLLPVLLLDVFFAIMHLLLLRRISPFVAIKREMTISIADKEDGHCNKINNPK